MESREERIRKRNNRFSMFAIGFVVVILLMVLIVQRNSLQNQLSAYVDEEQALNIRIKEEEGRTKEIDELKEYMQTDEYAEEVAREKLGLVKDNEIVFQEEETAVD